MPNDPFARSGDSLVAPAKLCFTIVPDDNAGLPIATKAIYIGTGGNLVLRPVGSDTDVTLANVVAGTILPIRVSAVRTASTAADLVGLA